MATKKSNPVDKQPITVKGMGYPNKKADGFKPKPMTLAADVLPSQYKPNPKGVETRGNGAATKGRRAYGPLA